MENALSNQGEGVGYPNGCKIRDLSFSVAMWTPKEGKQAGSQAWLRVASGWTQALRESRGMAKRMKKICIHVKTIFFYIQ